MCCWDVEIIEYVFDWSIPMILSARKPKMNNHDPDHHQHCTIMQREFYEHTLQHFCHPFHGLLTENVYMLCQSIRPFKSLLYMAL